MDGRASLVMTGLGVAPCRASRDDAVLVTASEAWHSMYRTLGSEMLAKGVRQRVAI
jgi:hypothetical protein